MLRSPRSSPRARRLAALNNVDLSRVGVAGRPILAADVLAAAREPGRATMESVTLVPDLSGPNIGWCAADVDYTSVERVAGPGIRSGVLAFVIRAAAVGLREYPLLNASVSESGASIASAVDVSLSVDVGANGNTAAVLRDVGRLSVGEIGADVDRLVGSAVSGTLRAPSRGDATFAVVDGSGHGGVLTIPPLGSTVATLSIAAGRPRPVVVTLADGSLGVAIRTVGSLALTWNVGLADATYAARFLGRVQELLETTHWDVAVSA